MSKVALRSPARRPFLIPILLAIGTSLIVSSPATAQNSCEDVCYTNQWLCVYECHQQGGCGYGCDQSCYESCDAYYDSCMDVCYPPPPPSPTWTGWLDRDDPSGTGDWESVAEFRTDGNNLCNGATPIDIECQTLNGVDWTSSGQTYACNAATGGVCRNEQQDCLDYRVRFLCP